MTPQRRFWLSGGKGLLQEVTSIHPLDMCLPVPTMVDATGITQLTTKPLSGQVKLPMIPTQIDTILDKCHLLCDCSPCHAGGVLIQAFSSSPSSL